MRNLLCAVLVTALLGLGVAGARAQDDPYSDQAVQQAKQFAGSTITILVGAGLGAADFKDFSGPLWEKLTGIKINWSRSTPTTCSPASCRSIAPVPIHTT